MGGDASGARQRNDNRRKRLDEPLKSSCNRIALSESASGKTHFSASLASRTYFIDYGRHGSNRPRRRQRRFSAATRRAVDSSPRALDAFRADRGCPLTRAQAFVEARTRGRQWHQCSYCNCRWSSAVGQRRIGRTTPKMGVFHPCQNRIRLDPDRRRAPPDTNACIRVIARNQPGASRAGIRLSRMFNQIC
jgi:hypothetical protein